MYQIGTTYVFVMQFDSESLYIEGLVTDTDGKSVRLNNVKMLTQSSASEVIGYCKGEELPPNSTLSLPDGYIIADCKNAIPVQKANTVPRWGMVWHDDEHQVLCNGSYISEQVLRAVLSVLKKGTDIVIISPSGERWTETVS